MTDQPEVDDPAYDELRGLLADARVAEPMPPEVAARLDATLTDLRAERLAEEPAAVIPLRRRSRLAPRLLAAAALVVVVGGTALGLQQNSADDNRTTSLDAGSSTGLDADAATPGAPEMAPPDASLGGLASSPGRSAADGGATASRAVPAFTSAGFASEAAAYTGYRVPMAADPGAPVDTRDDSAAPPGTKEQQRSDEHETVHGYAALSKELRRCTGPADPDGTVTPVTFDGKPAALVVAAPKDGAQVVEAWSCDGRTKLAGTTVRR